MASSLGIGQRPLSILAYTTFSNQETSKNHKVQEHGNLCSRVLPISWKPVFRSTYDVVRIQYRVAGAAWMVAVNLYNIVVEPVW